MKNLKIISLSIIIMLFANLDLFSQEENKATSKSMIVGSVMGNPANKNYNDKNFGANLSFRYNPTYSSDYDFLCLNVGYTHYKNNEISKYDYTITFGNFHNYNLLDNKINNIYNFEIGIIYKDIEAKKIRPLISFGTGVLLHIYKNIDVEILYKVQMNTYDSFYCGVGAGLSYSF